MQSRLWILIILTMALTMAACNPDGITDTDTPEVPGVSSGEIVLGSSLALTGHAGYLGTQTLRGAEAYLQYVNENGGVHGRTIRIKAKDDSYDPPRCLANTQEFIIDNDVFALFCYVGTPTTVKVLPLLEEAKIPLVGMFTGANAMRQPFNEYVINIRPSYYQETGSAISHMVKDLGFRRIAVFYQYDAYGFDGLIGTELALKRFDLEPIARGSYIRGTIKINEGFNKIKESKAEAVVMVGTYDACSRFIRLADAQHYNPVFFNVSFVGAEELARLVGNTNSTVIMSQVVPPPTAPDNDAALQYVALMHHYFPDDTPSFVGLEGFLNARILVEGLRKAGRFLTRRKFIKAIESIRNYELGPGMSITYGEFDRQGLDTVYFTRLSDGTFTPFSEWPALKKEREAHQ